MYTTHQIAKYLRTDFITVEKWILSGELKAKKRRHEKVLEWVVTKEDLLDYLAKLNGGAIPFSIPLCT